jgi:hypothetical protein
MVRYLEINSHSLLIPQRPTSTDKKLLAFRRNQEGNQKIYFNPTIMQENGLNNAEIFQQSLTDTRQHTSNLRSQIVVSSQSTSPPPDAASLVPILSYGGVAVAVIFAMAWFNQTQLKSFLEILKVINHTRK